MVLLYSVLVSILEEGINTAIRRDIKMSDVTVACIQAGSIYLDPSAATDKILKLIEKASKKGANLILLPELILSGYPNFNVGSIEYRRRYNASAVLADGPELTRISEAAGEYGTIVVLGFNERDPDYPEVVYDSACVINASGELVGTHRKISPFGAEKIIFKAGDARDIRLFETEVGKLGIGLCFENLNPLYRKALTLLGEEIHCSLWVTSQDTRHVVESSAVVAAVEGGVYVAVASQVTTGTANFERGLSFIGGSCVLDPWGNYLAEPVYKSEKTLFATIRPGSWDVRKFQSRGIEARDDLLSLNIATERYSPLNRVPIEKFETSNGSIS
jgi:nitrilase